MISLSRVLLSNIIHPGKDRLIGELGDAGDEEEPYLIISVLYDRIECAERFSDSIG